MTQERPLILVTNDDGYDARGIQVLATIASAYGDVLVVAPDGARSGMSSALTVNSPLRLVERAPVGEVRVFSCSGTPVDCVKTALHALTDRKPDLLLSGINHGSNAAVNNIYSGTMGAAMEGCIVGIPSVGFSILDHSPSADFDPIRAHVDSIIASVMAKGLPAGICLNVNFPARCEVLGVKVVRAAIGHWTEEYADYTDPHGKPFYWLTGKFHNEEPGDPATDEYWLARQYGTVVPIRPDQTAADKIEYTKSLLGL